jgi:hypothetical protein
MIEDDPEILDMIYLPIFEFEFGGDPSTYMRNKLPKTISQTFQNYESALQRTLFCNVDTSPPTQRVVTIMVDATDEK